MKILFHHEIFFGLGHNSWKKPWNGKHSHPVGVSEKLPFFKFRDEEIAAILLLPITISVLGTLS
jgi:hypothetical protein